MDRNEIKKILYKEKPVAVMQRLLPTQYEYRTKCSLGTIDFVIPIEEGSGFGDELPAQLLIRWLV